MTRVIIKIDDSQTEAIEILGKNGDRYELLPGQSLSVCISDEVPELSIKEIDLTD